MYEIENFSAFCPIFEESDRVRNSAHMETGTVLPNVRIISSKWSYNVLILHSAIISLKGEQISMNNSFE